MRIRIYMDENAMKNARVVAIRNQGIEVRTVQDAGKRGQTDEQQLIYASEHGLVIYSYNVGHFMALHTEFLNEGRHMQGSYSRIKRDTV